MAEMGDAWVRVDRAKSNFEALKNAIATFRREHPDNETVGMEHDGKGNVRLLARIKQRPPREWGLAIGDVLVDLRCALDYAVYALAIGNSGKDPPDHAKSLEFPICEHEERWREAIGRNKLAGLSEPAIAYIKTLQPFVDGNGGATAALFGLEELVGINKHRFIYVAWARLDTLRLPMKVEGMSPFTIDARHIPGELKDGAELAVIHLQTATDHAKLEVSPSISTKVVIEPSTKGWLDILDFGGKFGAFLDYQLRALEHFLMPGHEPPPMSAPIALTPW
jgi:hypothetical protein